MVYELQYINQTILFGKSITASHRNHVNRERERGRNGAKRSLFHTHIKSTHACTISDHAEDPERADMRQQKIMNTVHLSLFPPHENAHKHTQTHTQSYNHSEKEHRGSTEVFKEYKEVECDSAVEGSEMKSGKVARGGSLFFQRAEAVLHVLQ